MEFSFDDIDEDSHQSDDGEGDEEEEGEEGEEEEDEEDEVLNFEDFGLPMGMGEGTTELTEIGLSEVDVLQTGDQSSEQNVPNKTLSEYVQDTKKEPRKKRSRSRRRKSGNKRPSKRRKIIRSSNDDEEQQNSNPINNTSGNNMNTEERDEDEDDDEEVPVVRFTEDGMVVTENQREVNQYENFVEVFDEGRKHVTYQTFARSKRSRKWNDEGTDKLFTALRMFGQQFEMISRLFPYRQRKDVKSQYLKEEKRNPNKVKWCLSNKIPIDYDWLQRCTDEKDRLEGIEDEIVPVNQGVDEEEEEEQDRRNRIVLFGNENDNSIVPPPPNPQDGGGGGENDQDDDDVEEENDDDVPYDLYDHLMK